MPAASNPFFPFLALGFRCNPFGALTDREWADCAILSPTLTPVLHTADHVQLIGPKGCGKTTHLLALADHLTAAGTRLAYEHLLSGQHRFITPLPGLDCFLLDEAQRLGPFARGRLLRAAARGLRLVIATHTDVTRHITRHGLALTTIDIEALNTPAHLAAVIERRLAFAALGNPPAVTLAPEVVTWLWSTYHGDLRSALDHLYTVFQRLDAPGVLTVLQLCRLGN